MRISNILILWIVVSFASCNKDSGEKYTIKGKLLQSCDNPVPVAGQELILERYIDGARQKYMTVATTTTDDNGEFSLTYSSLGYSAKLSMKPKLGGFAYLWDIPTNRDINFDVHIQDNFFYLIKIKTEKAYTQNDTLFYSLGPKEEYIIGPFKNDQVIDTVLLSSGQIWAEPEFTSHVQYIWKLGRNYVDNYWGNKAPTDLIACKKYNEVVLDLTKAVK